jgi:hypothetical protein
MYLASSRFPGSLILKKKEYGKCFVFRYRKITVPVLWSLMLICMFGLELIYFINNIGAGNNFGSGSRISSGSTITVYNE